MRAIQGERDTFLDRGLADAGLALCELGHLREVTSAAIAESNMARAEAEFEGFGKRAAPGSDSAGPARQEVHVRHTHDLPNRLRHDFVSHVLTQANMRAETEMQVKVARPDGEVIWIREYRRFEHG